MTNRTRVDARRKGKASSRAEGPGTKRLADVIAFRADDEQASNDTWDQAQQLAFPPASIDAAKVAIGTIERAIVESRRVLWTKYLDDHVAAHNTAVSFSRLQSLCDDWYKFRRALVELTDAAPVFELSDARRLANNVRRRAASRRATR